MYVNLAQFLWTTVYVYMYCTVLFATVCSICMSTFYMYTVNHAIWSVIQLNAAGNILTVHYKDMKCDVSFSLGSVSTLFR